MSKWITLRVLHTQTLKYESDIDVLVSEICLLQQYEEVADQEVPPPPGAENPKPFLMKGHPAFCAVSVKSGLQFRVENRKEEIQLAMTAYE